MPFRARARYVWRCRMRGLLATSLEASDRTRPRQLRDRSTHRERRDMTKLSTHMSEVNARPQGVSVPSSPSNTRHFRHDLSSRNTSLGYRALSRRQVGSTRLRSRHSRRLRRLRRQALSLGLRIPRRMFPVDRRLPSCKQGESTRLGLRMT